MFQTTRNEKSFLLQHKLICCYDNKLPYVCLNLIILHVNILINTCFCPPEPDVIRVIVEGNDVILPCSLISKENIVFKSFVWKKDDKKQVFAYDAGLHTNNDYPGQDEQFKGRVSHFPGELKSGNASIIIRNTRMEDSGNYTCVFPRLQPSQLFHIKLVVGGECFHKTIKGDILCFL